MTHPLRSLYICYFPLTEPLVQTQVVAYLAGLARQGHTIHLLTYETLPLTSAQIRTWRRRLRAQNIVWHHLKYHKRPSLPATIFDVMCGVVRALPIIHRHKIQAIHARAHVPATMGLMLKKLAGTRLIFDIRGLMAEEYVDIGTWKTGNLPFRITKAMERKCIRNADGIVVLTERVRRVLFGGETRGRPIRVIPCCADLSRIEAQSGERETMREKLKLRDKTVLIYLGKFSGWYLQREMVDFFKIAKQEIPNLHFLVLTQSEAQLIVSEFDRAAISANDYTITQSAPDQVGAFLAASDFAISFIAACPSKIASSPTKFGEYLAAGLPTVVSVGVGDVDLIVEEHDVGVLVEEFSDENYRRAAREILPLCGDEIVRQRCRRAAHATASLQEIGLPRYHELYQSVARNIEKDAAA